MVLAFIEGLGLGLLLVVYCLIGIKDGAVGMVYLYHKDIQDRCIELGLTTKKQIKKRFIIFVLLGLIFYIVYAIGFVYGVNRAKTFYEGFLQMSILFFTCSLIDRIFVDEIWVCHTKKWIIRGTDDLMPYITTNDKIKKWVKGFASSLIVAAILAGIMSLIIK